MTSYVKIICLPISNQYKGKEACKKNSLVLPELLRYSKCVFKPQGRVNYELNVILFYKAPRARENIGETLGCRHKILMMNM